MQGEIEEILRANVYAPHVLASLARRHEYHDAQDILQDVAIKLWQAELSTHVDNPRKYVSRAIRNRAIDVYRRFERRIKLVRNDGLHLAEAPAEVHWSQVDDLVDMLPPTERDAVRQKLTRTQATDTVGVARAHPSAVRKRLSRACAHLSAILMG